MERATRCILTLDPRGLRRVLDGLCLSASHIDGEVAHLGTVCVRLIIRTSSTAKAAPAAICRSEVCVVCIPQPVCQVRHLSGTFFLLSFLCQLWLASQPSNHIEETGSHSGVGEHVCIIAISLGAWSEYHVPPKLGRGPLRLILNVGGWAGDAVEVRV